MRSSEGEKKLSNENENKGGGNSVEIIAHFSTAVLELYSRSFDDRVGKYFTKKLEGAVVELYHEINTSPKSGVCCARSSLVSAA